MKPIDFLRNAENFIFKNGNQAIFYKDYTEARQDYDIVSSVEIAISKQNFLNEFLTTISEFESE